MSHLGKRLTALVDGELGHEERDRALAHLATCPQCRSEAEELRRLKSRLRSLRSAAPTGEFLLRLNGLADTGPADLGERSHLSEPSRTSDLGRPGGLDEPGAPAAADGPGGSFDLMAAVPPARSGLAGPPASGPTRTWGRGRTAAGGRPRGRAAAGPKAFRGRYLVAGAATLAVLGVGAVSFTAGAEPGRLPQVSPALERFAVEHALTANEIPVTGTTAVVERPVRP
ncbi:MAG TPA: zf-HC2 domain-containing protein [Actinomadura sp.]|nr:zf-HC2 domain-containing protein [Actinomadura sp.]